MTVILLILPKIGCHGHGNIPSGIGKEVRVNKIQTNAYHLVKKIWKIGPVDSEIIWLKEVTKKKEINACKAPSPPGKFVERDK